jgi:hypothetical protein
MKNPSTEKQTPLERQLTVVVAWLAHHSDQFARALLRRFFDGDTEALGAMSDELRLGARTWGMLRAVNGITGPLYPDITISASNRAFELIIEMKVDADVHLSCELEGRLLYQPDAYVYSWIHNYDASLEAIVRRVGMLTREGVARERAGPELWPELADYRAAAVTWSDLRDDLRGLLDRGEIEADVRTVGHEVVEAIDNFVLATAVPGIVDKLKFLPPELAWGYRVLELLGPSLAEALPGGTLKQSFSLGAKHVYIGCNVYFTGSEGERCVWLQVSPADGGYSVAGRPVSMWALEQTDHGPWSPEIRRRAIASGFRDETDIPGYKAFRRGFPMKDLELRGDEAAQSGWLLGELAPIFAA